jgi:hypothetical protein
MKFRALALGLLVLTACGGGSLASPDTTPAPPATTPTLTDADKCANDVEVALNENLQNPYLGQGTNDMMHAWGIDSPAYQVLARVNGQFFSDAVHNGDQAALNNIRPVVQQACKEAYPGG